MTYKTKQKDLILNLLKECNDEFSIKDIYDKLQRSCGLTTIYRLVDKLCDEGQIKKIVKNNSVYYQYLEDCDSDNHFYLKCEKCGMLIHIDCDCIIELQNHIFDEHQFRSTNKNIMINGICNNCLKKGR